MTVIISILLVVITFLLYKIFYLKRENIDLLNPSRTIRTKFRIRLYDRTSLLYNDIILSWFTILKINGSSNSHAISFSNDDILAKAIILEYMWKYVIEYHEKLGSEAIEH